MGQTLLSVALLQSRPAVFVDEKRRTLFCSAGKYTTIFVDERCPRGFQQGDRQECLSHIEAVHHVFVGAPLQRETTAERGAEADLVTELQPRIMRFKRIVSAIEAMMLNMQPDVRKRMAMAAAQCATHAALRARETLPLAPISAAAL